MSRAPRHTSPPRARARRLRALVVYESLVGDTGRIAETVVEGLDADFDIALADICDVDPGSVGDYDLVVTGEPSQVFGLVTDLPEVATDHVGMKQWLANLPEAHEHQFCACFDTRTPLGTYGGEPASVNAIHAMHELGYTPLSRQTFHVASIGGPLLPGELDRAKAWAHSLATRVPAT